MSNVRIGLKPQHQNSYLLQSDSNYLNQYLNNGYSVFLLQITNQSYKQLCKKYFQSWSSNFSNDINSLDSLHVPHPNINHTDLISGKHLKLSIGLISSWIELDNDDLIINEFSFQALQNEISLANYLGIKTFMLNPPKNINNIQIFSSNIYKILNIYPSINISISLPISQDLKDENISYYDSYSTWSMWNSIRLNCNYHPNLSVSLAAPKSNIPNLILDRWLLEPIKFYLISASRFLPNAKSYPVLHKFNQLIIWKLIQFKALDLPVILLHGIDSNNITNTNTTTTNNNNTTTVTINNGSDTGNLIEFDNTNKSTYLSYIQHIISISNKTDLLPYIHSFTLSALKNSNIPRDKFSSSLILQSPLEPIIQNLDNETYKIFEQDTYKYDQYERAMIKAIMNLKKSWNSNSKPHILFLGPGRGPLIDRFFSALEYLSVSSNDFIITAVEKNPNVMIILNQKNIQHWNSQINVINADSRDYINLKNEFSYPKFNMVISELIGSFGCNELMPECIDSVSNYDLCDKNCIFIPQDLHCFVSPIYSPKLWKLASSTSIDKLYVPMVPEMDVLLDSPKEIWSFNCKISQKNNKFNTENSSNNLNKHNSRQCRISLEPNRKGSIHGLAGFFSSTLYSDIIVSNLPKPPGLIDTVSWLPAFLPFDQPLNIYDGHEVSLFIKRVCSSDSVWYEWSVECFLYMLVPNTHLINTPPSTPASIDNNNKVINSNNNHTAKITPSLLMSKKDSEKINDDHIIKQSVEMDRALNHSNHTYDDLSLYPTKSANDGHSSKSNSSSDYKVRVSTGISRVHNLNGTGFKFRLN